MLRRSHMRYTVWLGLLPTALLLLPLFPPTPALRSPEEVQRIVERLVLPQSVIACAVGEERALLANVPTTVDIATRVRCHDRLIPALVLVDPNHEPHVPLAVCAVPVKLVPARDESWRVVMSSVPAGYHPQRSDPIEPEALRSPDESIGSDHAPGAGYLEQDT